MENLEAYIGKAKEAAEHIRRNWDERPEALIFAGTGLGDCAGAVKEARVFDYGSLPHFPRSTVPGHDGELVLGRIGTRPVALMRGRFHLYEGYSVRDVTFPVRVMQELGAKTLIVTNASGGLNLSFRPGDIMVVTDHLNLTGENPLVGPNHEPWGLRFPGMVAAYDRSLLSLTKRIGTGLDLVLCEGVYAGLKGPSLETPAEMRYLKTIGADAVGFSTVQEVIAARHAGMRVLGLSVITNLCDPDHPENATVESVIAVAKQAAGRLETLIEKVVVHDDFA